MLYSSVTLTTRERQKHVTLHDSNNRRNKSCLGKPHALEVGEEDPSCNIARTVSSPKCPNSQCAACINREWHAYTHLARFKGRCLTTNFTCMPCPNKVYDPLLAASKGPWRTWKLRRTNGWTYEMWRWARSRCMAHECTRMSRCATRFVDS